MNVGHKGTRIRARAGTGGLVSVAQQAISAQYLQMRIYICVRGHVLVLGKRTSV